MDLLISASLYTKAIWGVCFQHNSLRDCASSPLLQWCWDTEEFEIRNIFRTEDIYNILSELK